MAVNGSVSGRNFACERMSLLTDSDPRAIAFSIVAGLEVVAQPLGVVWGTFVRFGILRGRPARGHEKEAEDDEDDQVDQDDRAGHAPDGSPAAGEDLGLGAEIRCRLRLFRAVRLRQAEDLLRLPQLGQIDKRWHVSPALEAELDLRLERRSAVGAVVQDRPGSGFLLFGLT